MEENLSYNLFNICRKLYERRRFIIFITIASMLAAILFRIIKPAKYEAKTVFILKNPLYADRNFLYNNETKFIDYFASEDDIDKFMLMAESDSVQNYIIDEMQLAKAYKYDLSSPEKTETLKRKFASNLNIVRTDKKSLTLSYTDKDEERAVEVANLTVIVLERSLRSFYNEIRANMYQSIANKIYEEDSAILSLTDTLVLLREKYGIYDVISPSRYNIMLTAGMKPNGKPDFAKGLEVVQNYESVKDQLVADRSRHISLVNQYTTGTKMNELPLTKVITKAKLPLKKSGTRLSLLIIVSGFAGAFFSILYILFMGFYRKITS
jgi:uncharacterized protein involved in exopolysaccharide biosynthesis